MDASVQNVHISLENHVKNKRINVLINDFDSQLSFSDSIIYCENKLNLEIKELGLNVKNGTFFNGTHLSGDFPLTFNKVTEQISIPFFDLKIDNQAYKLRADLSTSDQGEFKIALENTATDIKRISHFLSQNIQEKLRNFKISKPIYTYTEIESGLGPGSIPLIKINYKKWGIDKKIFTDNKRNNYVG